MWPWGKRRRADRGRRAGRGETADLGRRGERLAARTLKCGGMRILARNYRCPPGEIDLIALDRTTRRSFGAETIVFVEVKTRRDARHEDPRWALHAGQQRRMERAAEYYLSRHETEGLNVRFDMVTVAFGAGVRPEVRHFRDVF